MKITGNLLIGSLALVALPASWDYVHFMAREGTPVLGCFLDVSVLLLLFVTKALTGFPIGEMMKEGWPFPLMLLLLLLAMTVFPQIVLWLPQTMGYVTH